MRSMMASAWMPPPSLACQSFCWKCVQKIVGGGLLESPLHHLEHEGAEALVGLLEQPFVQHEQLEVRHLPHELGVAPGLIDGEPALLYSVTSKST